MYTHWDSCLDSGRNELLFEKRNKQFGAYVIRRDYSKSLMFAFTVTCVILSMLISLTFLRWPDTGVPETIKDRPDEIYKIIDYVIPPVEPVTKVEQQISGQQKTDELVNPVIVQHNNPEIIVPDAPGSAVIPDPVSPGPDPGTVTGTNPGPVIPDIITDPVPRKWFENMPKFPGGDEALIRYLSSRIQYPEDAKRKHVEGTVYITFVVDSKGKVSKVNVLHGIYPACDEVAVKAVLSMPDWIPGNQNGQNVSVEMNLPVNFRLR